MTSEQQTPENHPDSVKALHAGAEGPVVEVVDLEEFAKAGKAPPLARTYRFKVNETICTWNEPTITGRQILEQAKLLPPKDYTLREKMHGQPPRRIEHDEVVDLRQHGLEKFRAIKKEQKEGEAQGRRMAPVLEQDRLFLDGLGLPWEVITEGNTWVLIHGYPLPAGYTAKFVTLAIRMETGYPMTQLDMMYVFPAIARTNGRAIANANIAQPLDRKVFQGWSRHRTPANPWVPGQDSLETHYYLVEECFRKEAGL
jgi:hypothetical protein